MHHFWRLSEGGDNNLGLACTDDGLFLGRTPLIERSDGRFKSTDLRAITYRNMPTLTSTLNRYIGLVAKYDGGKLADIVISASDIRGRALNLVVPKSSISAAQRAVIEAASARAQASGVDLIVSEF